jgi:hypothetical protein
MLGKEKIHREVLGCAGCMEMEDGQWSKGLRKMKKCDYGWVQKEANETDANIGDTCMIP